MLRDGLAPNLASPSLLGLARALQKRQPLRRETNHGLVAPSFVFHKGTPDSAHGIPKRDGWGSCSSLITARQARLACPPLPIEVRVTNGGVDSGWPNRLGYDMLPKLPPESAKCREQGSQGGIRIGELPGCVSCQKAYFSAPHSPKQASTQFYATELGRHEYKTTYSPSSPREKSPTTTITTNRYRFVTRSYPIQLRQSCLFFCAHRQVPDRPIHHPHRVPIPLEHIAQGSRYLPGTTSQQSSGKWV